MPATPEGGRGLGPPHSDSELMEAPLLQQGGHAGGDDAGTVVGGTDVAGTDVTGTDVAGTAAPAAGQPELHPNWWLLVIVLYLGPLLITNQLFTGILLPPLLTQIVNTTAEFEPGSTMTKQSAMGAVSSLIMAINFSVPFWGWLADRCAFRFCRTMLVVVGQVGEKS